MKRVACSTSRIELKTNTKTKRMGMNVRANGHKNKILSIFIAIAIISLNLAFITPAKAAISTSSLISMTNSARVSNGLKPYSVNSALNLSAYAKAQDMLKYDYFEHYSPQGKSPWIFIKNAGYTYTFAGENLAINFNDSSATFKAWMASPTHRSNILDKDFKEIGMAAVTSEYHGKMTTVVVQHFGVRANYSLTSKFSVKKSNQANSSIQKKKHSLKPIKINLDLPAPIVAEINPKPANDFIWHISPALYLIKNLT